MANEYIHASRLSSSEVLELVWDLILFKPHREIFERSERSEQALRPVIFKLEERIFLESDDVLSWHLFTLRTLSMHRGYRPFVDECIKAAPFLMALPRNFPGNAIELKSPTTDAESEINCLFDCPQHLPPNEFVRKYGKMEPIGYLPSKQTWPDNQEQITRANLKATCGKCSGLYRTSYAKSTYFLNCAQHFCASHGRPRNQRKDVFLAKLAFHLQWCAWELTTVRFRYMNYMRLVAKLKASSKGDYESEKRRIYKEGEWTIRLSRKNARQKLLKLILAELEKNPLRVNRRASKSDTQS